MDEEAFTVSQPCCPAIYVGSLNDVSLLDVGSGQFVPGPGYQEAQQPAYYGATGH